MKVSRKVARRSRKHTSSVSRRRLRNNKNKSGYRKKHAKTQKGGKYGKRGRSYKRVHTHKRGRRFHGGGGDKKPGAGLSFLERMMYSPSKWAYQEEQNILRKKREDHATITDPSQFTDKENGGKLITHSTHYDSKYMSLVTYDPNLEPTDESNYRSPVITLKCQKKTGGFFPAESQKFSCYISYHYDINENEIRVYVSFTREDNDDVVFQFGGTPENVAKQLKNLDGLKQVRAKTGASSQTDGETYSFNFPKENQAMFNAIADAIKFFEDKVSVTTPSQYEKLQEKKQLQKQQEQLQPQGESISDSAKYDDDAEEGFEMQPIASGKAADVSADD